MKYLIALITALLLVASCEKDQPAPPPPDPDPIDTTKNHVGCDPTAFVPIYYALDTLPVGAAHSQKCDNGWLAAVECRLLPADLHSPENIGLGLLTYTLDAAQREHLGFSRISPNRGETVYRLTSLANADIDDNLISCFYTTWRSDGDVPEDRYVLDTTETYNHLTIKKLDLVNRRIEGSFYAAFDIVEPRKNPKNPKRVVFSNGTFWGLIQD